MADLSAAVAVVFFVVAIATILLRTNKKKGMRYGYIHKPAG